MPDRCQAGSTALGCVGCRNSIRRGFRGNRQRSIPQLRVLDYLWLLRTEAIPSKAIPLVVIPLLVSEPRHMLHLVKLSVGTDSIEDLAAWQAERLASRKAAGEKKPLLFHRTGQRPKRDADLLEGGSIYWVIKGVIQARQKLIGFEEGVRPDGRACCHILIEQPLVPVRPTPRRAFQGWRYLGADDAPPDLGAKLTGDIAGMPPRMRRELAELGLL